MSHHEHEEDCPDRQPGEAGLPNCAEVMTAKLPRPKMKLNFGPNTGPPRNRAILPPNSPEEREQQKKDLELRLKEHNKPAEVEEKS